MRRPLSPVAESFLTYVFTYEYWLRVAHTAGRALMKVRLRYVLLVPVRVPVQTAENVRRPDRQLEKRR